jgi:hypothetical protein
MSHDSIRLKLVQNTYQTGSPAISRDLALHMEKLSRLPPRLANVPQGKRQIYFVIKVDGTVPNQFHTYSHYCFFTNPPCRECWKLLRSSIPATAFLIRIPLVL